MEWLIGRGNASCLIGPDLIGVTLGSCSRRFTWAVGPLRVREKTFCIQPFQRPQLASAICHLLNRALRGSFYSEASSEHSPGQGFAETIFENATTALQEAVLAVAAWSHPSAFPRRAYCRRIYAVAGGNAFHAHLKCIEQARADAALQTNVGDPSTSMSRSMVSSWNIGIAQAPSSHIRNRVRRLSQTALTLVAFLMPRLLLAATTAATTLTPTAPDWKPTIFGRLPSYAEMNNYLLPFFAKYFTMENKVLRYGSIPIVAGLPTGLQIGLRF